MCYRTGTYLLPYQKSFSVNDNSIDKNVHTYFEYVIDYNQKVKFSEIVSFSYGT